MHTSVPKRNVNEIRRGEHTREKTQFYTLRKINE